MSEEIKKSICFFCKPRCVVNVHVDNGRLIKVEPSQTVPCSHDCPAGIDVPRHIRFITQGKFREAMAVIQEKIPFPSIIGHVCPQPCEIKCKQGEMTEPIAIRALHRFAFEQDDGKLRKAKAARATGKRVAIAGSGPAGLTAAYYLARLGHSVTVFERGSKPGGIMRACIPEFRLPQELLDRDIENILKQGVELKTNTPIGNGLGISELKKQGYNAIFLAPGAPLSQRLDIGGTGLNGVLWGIDFLRDVNLGRKIKVGKQVLVIGGGNAAIDAARTAKRLGAKEVNIYYRRTQEEMPAYESEIIEALDEGININCSWSPKRITGDGRVKGMEFIHCTTVFDERGKSKLHYDESVTTSIASDMVILAIGQSTDLSFLDKKSQQQLAKAGLIKVKDAVATDIAGVFAGGDAVSGPASVIKAIAAGRQAAISIDKYLGGKGVIDEVLAPPEGEMVLPEQEEAKHQVQMPRLPLSKRVKGFTEVELGFNKKQALEEAGRCLRCDRENFKGCRLPAAAEWFYHPDRLKFPMKRVGARGEGKWERISWDQALDEVAAKLKEIKKKYGAEAIAAGGGTSRTWEELRSRFMLLLGSPNTCTVGNICHGNSAVIGILDFGWFPYWLNTENLEITKCVMLIGRNPPPSQQTTWRAILKAKKNGAKLIVVDPRYTETARAADLWLQIRPGTDTALLLSMMNTIIEEGLYDKDFVKKWCLGFDKLAKRARDYPAEKVAKITWIPAEKIKEAARMFALNRPSCAIEGMGVCQHTNCTQTLRAKNILAAIVGNIDVEGGAELLGPAPFITDHDMEEVDRMPQEQRRKSLGIDKYKLYNWPGYELTQPNVERVWGKRASGYYVTATAPIPVVVRAMAYGEPYPVKALILLSHNMMLSDANTKMVYKALKNLDLLVVNDFFPTPTAELADYVFPAASWLERPFIWNYHNTTPTMIPGEQAVPATVPGEYDRRDDYLFWRGLGIRMGQKADWPWKSVEEMYDYRLKPMGYTFKELLKLGKYEQPRKYRKYEKTGFGTPTGKVELASTVMEKLGYDPLPRHEEPMESTVRQPKLAKEYPLILITGGRFVPFFHSEHRQVDSLRRKHPYPITQIHPKTAKKLGINDGDWVWIETQRGRIMQKCQYYEDIEPRIVHAQHDWWYPELPGEEPWLHGVWISNANVLTDDNPEELDEAMGSWQLKTCLCKVYKVKKYEEGLPRPL